MGRPRNNNVDLRACMRLSKQQSDELLKRIKAYGFNTVSDYIYGLFQEDWDTRHDLENRGSILQHYSKTFLTNRKFMQ